MEGPLYSGFESSSLVSNEFDSQPETTNVSDGEIAAREHFIQAYNQAIRYLSRREYSVKELEQRLSQKEYPPQIIQTTIEKLIAEGYQSDERFTEMYIRSRISAGDGPFKIKISLREKGICESLALAVMDTQDVDWREQALHVKEKRFGSLCSSPEQLAKQIRYLKNKGYYQDDIQAVTGLGSS